MMLLNSTIECQLMDVSVKCCVYIYTMLRASLFIRWTFYESRILKYIFAPSKRKTFYLGWGNDDVGFWHHIAKWLELYADSSTLSSPPPYILFLILLRE